MSQTLQRAITILTMVSKRPRRIAEIAAELGVHHSTALRLVHTLRDNRLLLEQPDHAYRLGSGLLTLANRALEQIDLRDVAKPSMRALGEATRETIHLAVMEGGSVVYLDKVEADHPVRMYSRIGGLAPVHCTGVGKAILAHLDEDERAAVLAGEELARHTHHTITDPDMLERELAEVRRTGVALDREEHELGIHCIAAPIGGTGTRAALSISAPASRLSFSALEALATPLRAATDEITAALGEGRP